MMGGRLSIIEGDPRRSLRSLGMTDGLEGDVHTAFGLGMAEVLCV